MNITEKDSFAESVKRALADPELFKQHRKVMDGMAASRKRALDETQEFERKRELAHHLRMQALENLPELLEEFEAHAIKNGFQVHWADTCEDANNIIKDVLDAAGAKRIIKGKSMISEETGLNHFLEEHGFEVVESDLGELIVQIAEEMPSHIIAPALHKNTAQIAALFRDKLGMPYCEEPSELTALAREYMRTKYYEADAGITGVNFAVAETGTLCLVENEGNGRFSSTAPPVHIAMMSLDKLLPKLTDLPLLLELLTKSATGQRITVYVNMISGPRRTSELDGPEQAHIVILNNNRTEILHDKLLRETLKCIRCGACINNCPIYVNIGGHAYNSVIPGPIGKILMPQLYGMASKGTLPTASSLCGACVEVCPVKIPITRILLELRSRKARTSGGGAKKWLESLSWTLWSQVASRPRVNSLFRRLAPLFPSWVLGLTPFGSKWQKHRTLPKIQAETLSELAKKEGFHVD